MNKIPAELVNTWLFLLDSKDPKLAKQKRCAHQNIIELFGNAQVAKLYVEQQQDHDIEVVII